MGAPHSILDLIERFDRNVEASRSGAYSDAVYGVGQANVGVNKYAGVLVKYHE